MDLDVRERSLNLIIHSLGLKISKFAQNVGEISIYILSQEHCCDFVIHSLCIC